MAHRRWWGIGLLGIALAGTITLVVPSQAQTSATTAVAATAVQPDRAVQLEATTLATRIDGAIRRGTGLLETLSENDLGVFSHERLSLSSASDQWPVTLFTAGAAKGADVTVQPPGDRFLAPEDVADVQRRGEWFADRPETHAVVVAVPSRTGQVLAARLPYSYFTRTLASLSGSTGVKRYLLGADGKPLDDALAPSGDEKDWCVQLLQEGEGFLATPDALFAVARVPVTGWAVIVRYPVGGPAGPALTLEPSFLSGPTLVATAPLNAPGLPKGLLLFPVAGVALLFGLALVGWKQKWPGLEDGPIAFGEQALLKVAGPFRERASGRAPEPNHERTELANFAAEIPPQLPAALGGGDVEFLRTEQVRNLREVWNHTEERLSGQRSWVREEVRRVQESTTASISELGSIVNLAEQRLEDARAAWSDVHSSLLMRIDEARANLRAEQDARRDLADHLSENDARLEGDIDQVASRLKGVHEELGEEIARIDGRLKALKEDAAGKDDVEGQFKSLRSELGSVREELGADFAKVETLFKGLNEQLVALEAQVKEAHTGLTTRRDAHGQLVEEVESIRRQTVRLEATLQGASERMESFRLELDERMEDLAAEIQDGAIAPVSELGARQTLLETGVADLRRELDRVVDDTLPGLRTDLNDLRQILDQQVEAWIRRSEERLQTLEDQQHELRLATETGLADTRAALDGRLIDFEGTLSRHEQTQSDLKGGMETMRQQVIERLENVIGDTERRLKVVEASHAEAKVAYERQVTTFNKELQGRFDGQDATLRAHLDQRLADLASDAALRHQELQERHEAISTTLTESLGPLQEGLILLGDLASRTAEFDERLETQSNRIEEVLTLESQLNGFIQRTEDRLKKLSKLRKEIDQSVSDQLGNQRAALDTRFTEVDEELEVLRTDADSTQDRVSALENSHGRLNDALLSGLEEHRKATEDRIAELSRRLAASDERNEKLDRSLEELRVQLGDVQQALDSSRVVSSEFGGLKGRLEGLAMAQGRQQEVLNTVLKQLGDLQGQVSQQSASTAVESQVRELTQIVQQLAEQGRLLAQAVDASSVAADRSQGWVAEQLGVVRSEQQETVSSLERRLQEREQENDRLREQLVALRESQEALGGRLHMVVQVLAKLSK